MTQPARVMCEVILPPEPLKWWYCGWISTWKKDIRINSPSGCKLMKNSISQWHQIFTDKLSSSPANWQLCRPLVTHTSKATPTSPITVRAIQIIGRIIRADFITGKMIMVLHPVTRRQLFLQFHRDLEAVPMETLSEREAAGLREVFIKKLETLQINLPVTALAYAKGENGGGNF